MADVIYSKYSKDVLQNTYINYMFICLYVLQHIMTLHLHVLLIQNVKNLNS